MYVKAQKNMRQSCNFKVEKSDFFLNILVHVDKSQMNGILKLSIGYITD